MQVQAWSIHDLDEIFSLRSVLEPWGCRLAATRGTIDVDALDALAHRMDEVAPDRRPTDVDELTELNNRFHRMILEASDNSRLAGVVSSVIQMPLVSRTFSRYTPDALRRSLAHHHELVAALAAPDPDWAESVMRSHVRAAWHSIRLRDGGDKRLTRNCRSRSAQPQVTRHPDQPPWGRARLGLRPLYWRRRASALASSRSFSASAELIRERWLNACG
ncbi:FCD domain-containing protein [Micromonospora sp. NBC_00389]|uniref:GntR family transcriptional regulator n=1 Tax=Micromonospora sp. NBC_00389 TaxID=2903586 RepID=UPI002E213FB2